jgi:hypothetical protein
MSSPLAPDQLVRDYLAAVDRALAGLPEQRRRAALDDLSGRIAASRGPAGDATRAVLDRLGDPDSVAAEIWRREAHGSDARPAGRAEAHRTLTTPTAPWPAITSPTLDAPIVAALDNRMGRRSGPVVWASVTVGVVALVLIGVVVFALLS